MLTKKITDGIYYVGANDRTTTRFEGLWPLPYGVSYNSYLVAGNDKTAIIDGVEISHAFEQIAQIKKILHDNTPDYLIVNHMEPDHTGAVQTLRAAFPNLTIVGNAKTIDMLKGYYGICDGTLTVADGDTIDLGGKTLKFALTPMVHWPETMMTYAVENKTLFSGDAFGCFGALNGGIIDEEMDTSLYFPEMTRYYSNIVGKYGLPVQKALQKLSGVAVDYICSTHGPVWHRQATEVIGIYDRLSKGESENGVVIAYASMYGHTEEMVEAFARMLAEEGVRNIRIHNVSYADESFVISDIYKYKGLVIASPTYNGSVFPRIDSLLKSLALRGVGGKVFARLGSFTWAGAATKTIDSIQGVMGIDKEDVKVNYTAVYTNGYDKLTLGSSYNFYFDTYGNVIGLDALASNYAVLDSLYIDRVEGKRGVDGLFGTPYFFNGEKAEGVAIDEVKGYDVKDEAVYSNSSKNDFFYYDVYSYTIDKDGVYTFENAKFDTSRDARFVAGNKYITVDEGRLQLNKDTQLLLQTKDSPDGKIAHYTGYDKLPSFSRAQDVQYLDVNNDGYVDLFYARVEEFTTRTVFVYDTKPVSSEIDADGNKIATMDVLELVENEWKDTTLKVYYKYVGEDSAWAGDIDEIGLYEVTEGENGVWYGIQKFASYYVDTYTTDGNRIGAYNAKTGSYVNFDLDNTTAIAKYEGSWTKGTVDTEDWTAKHLNSNSYIFVQYDDTKVGNTFDALAVYDLYIKAPVTVDGKETKDVEYYGKDFNKITVTFEHEYEMIDEAKMGNENLTVKYFDKDGKEVTLAPEGTKVAYAEVSYGTVVTDPIVITTTKQAAAAENLLNEGKCDVPGYAQDVIVYKTPSNDGYRTIWVSAADETFTVANLRTALEQALKCNFQKVEFFNTDFKTPVTNEDTQVASDMLVKVTSWDTSKTAEYQILVYNS